jgi:hypothetical protein
MAVIPLPTAERFSARLVCGRALLAKPSQDGKGGKELHQHEGD